MTARIHQKREEDGKMLSYIGKRLLQLIPVLIGMSIIVFGIIHLIPGDPAEVMLGENATQEAIEALHESLGLDEPLIKQYFTYMKGIFTGDLGTSLRTGVAISEEIVPFLTATLELAVVSLLIAVILGVNLGVIAAWKRASRFDYIAMVIALIGVSLPVFWLGLMEQLVFSQELGWLPSIGRFNVRTPIDSITGLYLIDTIIVGDWSGLWDVFTHLILPSVALGSHPMAIIARMTRSSMLEVMKADHIRTARAKGLDTFSLLYKHALKNASGPILTVVGLQLGTLLGGAVLTETIFGWPGIGRYIYTAISYRDYPVVQSGILIIAVLFVLINLTVDIIYMYIDPRVKK